MPRSDGRYHGDTAFVFLFLAFFTMGGSLEAAEIVYDAGKRRDPFVALTAEDAGMSAASSGGFRLEGVIYDPGAKSVAILNGKAYQVGEMAGEAKVVGIMKDHVVISVEGEEKTLWIRDEEKL